MEESTGSTRERFVSFRDDLRLISDYLSQGSKEDKADLGQLKSAVRDKDSDLLRAILSRVNERDGIGQFLLSSVSEDDLPWEAMMAALDIRLDQPDELIMPKLPRKEGQSSGREPRQFLKTIIKWIESEDEGRDFSRFHWTAIDDYIEMGYDARRLPDRFIDETLNKPLVLASNQAIWNDEGLGSLLQYLNNRKVISIQSGERWYLKIVED